MSPPRPRQHAAGIVRDWREHGADRILGGRWFDSGWSFGQPVKLVELSRFYALQCQMAVGKPLYAAGRIELCPFGAKDGDRIALSAQLAPQFSDALGLESRIKLDFVDE
jgi:hypothetical protein